MEIGLNVIGFGKPTSSGRSSGRPFLILYIYLYYEQQVVYFEEVNAMILPTMTYKEMYDHLAADRQKVEIKEEYLLPKAVKAFKKKLKFPAWEIYDYTIPSTNNKYVIYFYAESRVRADKPEVGSCCVIQDEEQRYFVEWIAGGYKHTPNQPISLIRQLHVYEPHFLVRYNERFGTIRVCR